MEKNLWSWRLRSVTYFNLFSFQAHSQKELHDFILNSLLVRLSIVINVGMLIEILNSQIYF